MRRNSDSRAARRAYHRAPIDAGYPLIGSGLWQQLSGVRRDPSGLAPRVFGGRQLDQKPRAAIEVVCLCRRKRDRPAVSSPQVGADREAKARPNIACRLVKRLENPLVLIGWKSRTRVADLNQRQPVGAN